MIKTLRKLGMEGMYLNIINDIYDKSIANSIVNGEKLKPFPLRAGRRQVCPLSTPIQNSSGIPSQSNKARKRNNNRHSIPIEIFQLSLFAGYMIL
jgi:hypothetical protein